MEVTGHIATLNKQVNAIVKIQAVFIWKQIYCSLSKYEIIGWIKSRISNHHPELLLIRNISESLVFKYPNLPNFFDAIWVFILKKVPTIRDPPNSWYPFGIKNHEMRGPPVLLESCTLQLKIGKGTAYIATLYKLFAELYNCFYFIQQRSPLSSHAKIASAPAHSLTQAPISKPQGLRISCRPVIRQKKERIQSLLIWRKTAACSYLRF